MDHIVQFAIGIDDERIREAVISSAEKQIISQIKQDLINKLFESSYYRQNATPQNPLSGYACSLFNDFLEENKTEILEKAAKLLADKLAKTKAGKALLEEVKP